MKRIFFLAVALIMAVLCPAQKQTGYVKTPGRLGPKGELISGHRIAGATLYFRDISAVGSGADGTFTFAVPGRSFVLTRVQKKDYELTDHDMLGKSHSTSGEPFIVVMDTPDALLERRLASERRQRRTLSDQLRAREDEIEALKAQQKITEADYRKKLQELYASQDKNEKLIAEMAERYARMDFDQMDDFRRRVAACIQNGELTRADSLLNTRGSLESRAAEIRDKKAALRANAEDIARRQQEQSKAESMTAREVDDFGADCYNRHEICLLEHKNDSAAYYLELRAAADTLNLEWQNDAGRFFYDYIADYNKAMYYFNRILSACGVKDDNNYWEAVAYSNIGSIYFSHGDYNQALEYYEKALKIWLDIFSGNHHEVATNYNNVGYAYQSQGEYTKALEFYEKALKIWLGISGGNHLAVATIYNNIGSINSSQRNYTQALECYEKALSIQLHILGENHPNIATIYNNIGFVYDSQGYNAKALEYYEKASRIWQDAFGENHPDVALVYSNIGSAYDSQGDYTRALEYNEKALKIWLAAFGENHPDVATIYNNIGAAYDSQEDYTQALEYYGKALKIRLEILGENHPDLATTYNNIGIVYFKQGDYAQALEYFEKALKIRVDIFGENHPDVDTNYTTIAHVYWTAKSKGEVLPGFDEFTSERVFVGTIAPGDTPAGQQGMIGEYVILEFGDWNIDSESSLLVKNEELRGKPKTVTVMQNGTISQHHFENTIGMQLSYKKIGKAERERIVAEYHKWKAQTGR